MTEGLGAFRDAISNLERAAGGGGTLDASHYGDPRAAGYYDIPQDMEMGVKDEGSLASQLYAEGWRSDPSDASERLYAPDDWDF